MIVYVRRKLRRRLDIRKFTIQFKNKSGIYCLALLLIYIGYLYFARLDVCRLEFLKEMLGIPRHKILCNDYRGGIANQMFVYAFSYSWATERNLQNIIQKGNILTKYFNIYPNTLEDHGLDKNICKCLKKYKDSIDCGYDEKLEVLPDTSLAFQGYFQSWKYWIMYEPDIRKAFQFKFHIRNSSYTLLKEILKTRNVSLVDGTTLIGVHVRNGDYSEPYYKKFGYKIAPASYLKSATLFFRRMFKKTLFIVCTNDIAWTRNALPKENDIFIVTGNSAVEDMSLLSLTNHTIMTVGTYGWMVGWLTGGMVIYYKNPYVAGSPYSNEFHTGNSDFFYPGWIAME